MVQLKTALMINLAVQPVQKHADAIKAAAQMANAIKANVRMQAANRKMAAVSNM
jgi:hypothetical protein